MKRSEILDTAKSHVTVDRNSKYGEPEDSFKLIAELWSAYRGEKFCSYDVAMMMALLKCARAKVNPSHTDSAIDGAGYLACAGEIASQSTEESILDKYEKTYMSPKSTEMESRNWKCKAGIIDDGVKTFECSLVHGHLGPHIDKSNPSHPTWSDKPITEVGSHLWPPTLKQA